MTAKVELLTPSGGKVILDPTDTAVDRTLTLPAVAGTVLNTASDIEAQVKTATSATGDAPIYACRAWVNFDGTTTPPTIRASGNVSSVTRTDTGDYTVNFTTDMPDADYSTAQMSGVDSGSGTIYSATFGESSSRSVSFVRFRTIRVAPASSASMNMSVIHIAIFR